ncbi:hypothetical protein [Caballeronia sp. LZ035]|uniref:hypothetical protein n=1 Tax=Caballeronia sp. LZ035 TaxID=3038568 RepID=UPI00286134E8|nr:hypothetical protein [Caballeronia sp. LZ035]MDR5763212.1 hypothetical protein [Caballeronia sp. LZ035]
MLTGVPVILVSGADLFTGGPTDAAVRKPVTVERLLELIENVSSSTAKVGRRIKATIDQLRYPTKNSLKAWHRDYEQCHDLRTGYRRLML